MRIFIVFRNAIYLSGLRSTLARAPGVQSVDFATSIAQAWESAALAEASVVVLDGDLGGAVAFVRDVTAQRGAQVLLCLHEVRSDEVLEAISNGVGGAIACDLLTPDTLIAALSAVAAGIFAFDAGVLSAVTGSAAPASDHHVVSAAAEFAPREQMVLSLVAAGLSNREIAQRLSYSERTIKTVLHDVVIKLGVKSRSQAVAMAVRERMI